MTLLIVGEANEAAEEFIKSKLKQGIVCDADYVKQQFISQEPIVIDRGLRDDGQPFQTTIYSILPNKL